MCVVLKSVLGKKSHLISFLSTSLVCPILELNSGLFYGEGVESSFPPGPQTLNPRFSTMTWRTASQYLQLQDCTCASWRH